VKLYQRAKALDLGAPLERLVAQPGVVAGLVTTPDGLPVAMRALDEETGEAWAAVAAVLANAAGKLLASYGQGGLLSATFQADRRSVLIRTLSLGFLVAVAEPQLDSDLLTARMRVAASDLERAASTIGDLGGE
jgi:predicted regulator of Ras-like GTPase activity (Roadblock/LC7/MglB family)